MNLRLQRGDIFCCSNPQSLGKIIKFVQDFGMVDSSSTFTHAGIILDKEGTTFEALWSLRKRNFFEALKGDTVIVGRNKNMTVDNFNKGWKAIKKYEGKFYPVFRLSLFLFPPLAKYFNLVDGGVCSELTSKFLYEAGLLDFGRGVFPDYLSDMIIRWKGGKIVYYGEL